MRQWPDNNMQDGDFANGGQNSYGGNGASMGDVGGAGGMYPSAEGSQSYAPVPVGVVPPVPMPPAPGPRVIKAKPRKRWLVVVIAFAVVVVVVIGSLVGLDLAGVTGGPKHQDYLSAQLTVKAIEKDQNGLVDETLGKARDYLVSDDDSHDGNNDSNKISDVHRSPGQWQKAYERDLDGFAAGKVMKDDDVKTAYNAYDNKTTSLTSTATQISSSVDLIRIASISCDSSKLDQMDTSNPSAADIQSFSQILSQCNTSMSKMAKVPDKPLANFASKLSQEISLLNDVYVIMARVSADPSSMTESDESTIQQKMSQFAQIGDIDTLGSDTFKKVEREMDDVSVHSQFTQLKSAVDTGEERTRNRWL